MAQKKTYIYHMLIGYYPDTELDFYMYARNADVAKAFCKDLYHDKKYNYYKPIKVGVSHTLRETQILQEYEADKLRNSIASKSDKYAEREIEAPKFIAKEDLEDLI